MERWLSYDQVSLIPTQVSTLEHRAEADISVQFGPVKLSLPLIAAPMPDVSNGMMTEKLASLGSLGWIHRFQDWQERTREFDRLGIGVNLIGFAIGLKDEPQYLRYFYQRGTRIFVLDTANGASTMVERAVKTLKDKYPDIFIVAGNVASAENFQKLEDWGADAIRVGIAGGSVCETRAETGVFSPMATAVKECAGPWGPTTEWVTTENLPNWANGYGSLHGDGLHEVIKWRHKKALLIADGGIKSPGDMCKALALGADLVMAGGIFAGTEESPGQVLKDRTGRKVKVLRGAASYSVQNGESEYNEGAETFVDYQGSVEKVIQRFGAGLRSSMSYMDARNLAEYRQNAQVVEIG